MARFCIWHLRLTPMSIVDKIQTLVCSAGRSMALTRSGAASPRQSDRLPADRIEEQCGSL